MKGIVKTYLNLRMGKPGVNASNPLYYLPGEEIEIVDTVIGDSFRDNNLWFQLNNGGYVWSGGIETGDVPVSIEINHWVNFFGIDKLWERIDLSKMNIAILDSGIDFEHDDLKDCIKGKENFFSPGQSCMDNDGHGTHCAGILAGTGVKKISGVAQGANLYVAKVVGMRGFGISENVLYKALEWSISNADIISMSLGIRKDNSGIHGLIKDAADKGKIFVSAIGNISRNPDRNHGDYPARYDEVISVGATNSRFTLSAFTMKNEKIDINVPGENIISTYPAGKGHYGSESGTSMATPFVTGLSAIFKAAYPNLNYQDLRGKLKSFCEVKQHENFSYRSIKPQPIEIV